MQARILVIDDRHSLVWFIQRVLQQEGFDVITAYDGTEGLRKAGEEKPGLIILDTVMPRMDGFEVYRQLQQDANMTGTPVLFLTIDEKVDREKLKALNHRRFLLRNRHRQEHIPDAATDFLVKPFVTEAIIARARVLLQSRKSAEESKVVSTSKPLILIVDDAHSLVRLAERTLQKEGFDVITAFDGLDGLRKVRDEKPDLIILDIVMPELDGVQVLQSIRQRTRTPVIMLTSEHETDTVKRTLALGADGYVVKPVSTTTLVARVKETLSGAGAAVA